jgi:hypothetical protein
VIGTWPRKGLCAFWEPGLHPSCALIVWLAAVLAAQFVGYAGLAALCLAVLVAAPPAIGLWLGYAWRARWLLLTLWLILAYNTPGEAFQDQFWAPTYEGVAEASLQAARLLVMLACLAWLFFRLGRERMVGALWTLLGPFRLAGMDTERLVVRLSLVLENLQRPQEKGAWRRILADHAGAFGEPGVISLAQLPWAGRDTLIVLLAGAGLMGAILL